MCVARGQREGPTSTTFLNCVAVRTKVVHSKPNSSSKAFCIVASTDARAPVVSNTTLPLLM